MSILLVEDDLDEARLTAIMLARTGRPHRLATCTDGAGALAHLGALADSGAVLPDLVLLDVHMPGLGGYEVLDRIRGDPRLESLSVAILSSATTDFATRARKHTADHVVMKPIDPSDLDLVLDRTGREV